MACDTPLLKENAVPDRCYISPDNVDHQKLSEHHKIIAEIISTEQIQYIDIPLYPNIGDHLIAHGTFRFFMEQGIPIQRATPIFQYKTHWLSATGTIVFGGGGNFGDLWIDIHKRRLQIINEAAKREIKILILLQTIYFQSKTNLEHDISFFRDIPNLYLFTRDFASFDIGKKICRNTFLVPDMSHHLYRELREIGKLPPSKNYLSFLRTDKESALHSTYPSVDWDSLLLNNKRYSSLETYIKLYKKLYKFSFDKKLRLWEKYSYSLVKDLSSNFSQYHTIITDRLHGMLLSLLIGRTVLAIDNNNKKISHYIQTWLK